MIYNGTDITLHLLFLGSARAKPTLTLEDLGLLV